MKEKQYNRMSCKLIYQIQAQYINNLSFINQKDKWCGNPDQKRTFVWGKDFEFPGLDLKRDIRLTIYWKPETGMLEPTQIDYSPSQLQEIEESSSATNLAVFSTRFKEKVIKK